MAAKAAIHAFLAAAFPTPAALDQKFFAELFYKKATAFSVKKGVDGRFRGHDG
jgi:hypothetical protein